MRRVEPYRPNPQKIKLRFISKYAAELYFISVQNWPNPKKKIIP